MSCIGDQMKRRPSDSLITAIRFNWLISPMGAAFMNVVYSWSGRPPMYAVKKRPSSLRSSGWQESKKTRRDNHRFECGWRVQWPKTRTRRLKE